MSKAREPKQTRRHFLKEFVGPPRRPRTAEERRVAMVAYEQAMATWRAECGDLAKRKNNFHRIADAERERGNGNDAEVAAFPPELMARRQAAMDEADARCAVMPSPTRTRPHRPATPA